MIIEHIRKKYGKKEILRDVSFQINEGECVGILGGNGSGKSTLLSILAGVNKPDGGSFFYGEDNTNLLSNRKLRNNLVGYVPQGNPLYEELTAKDNLRLWYDKKSLDKALEPGGVLNMLGVDKFLNTRCNKMSGGMKKRLSIGCAVSGEPKLLLLDEPSVALDLVCKEQIHTYIKNYLSKGGSVILVTHDIQDLEICDRFLLLKDGFLTPYEYKDADSLARELSMQ